MRWVGEDFGGSLVLRHMAYCWTNWSSELTRPVGPTISKINKILTIYPFNIPIYKESIGILLILGFYSFSSKLKSHYLEIKNNFTTDNKYLAVITNNGFWIKDEINETVSITNAEQINKNSKHDDIRKNL